MRRQEPGSAAPPRAWPGTRGPLAVFVAGLLGACSGGGGGGGPPPPPPPPPPAPGAVAVGSASYAVVEGAGRVTLIVLRTGGTAGAVGVTLTTLDGTAVQGEDYGPVAATVSFWRLPNRKELESLVETACRSPALNPIVFPDAPQGWRFTSTPTVTSKGLSSTVHAVEFWTGRPGGVGKTFTKRHARLVRGP